jgi:predicted TIM-barrel fold metal-dependent hydrolase
MSAASGKTEAERILFSIDEKWLGKYREPILEPDLPIVDPHHHLWDRGHRYLLDDLLVDTRSGHNIRSTVFLQCDSMYRAEGDPVLKPVGETEFVNGVAAMSASGLYGPARLCAGIVGFADLQLGAAVDRVLEAHLRAAGERFKGVRYCSVWDADPTIKSVPIFIPKGLLLDTKFREGFARLARYGLSFDAWLFHTQIPELADLARAFPDTTIVMNHIGGPLAIGAYAGEREEVFDRWRGAIVDIARCPNVQVKLGGMGMHTMGFELDKRETPASSEELAVLWRPYVEVCLAAFGVERAMFESNFPVDKRSCSYAVLWNAFKRLAKGCSPNDKTALFSGTARRVYRLLEV